MSSRLRAMHEAAEAAGALFEAAGWPWRLERRKRHLIQIVTLPNGVDRNIIVTEKRDGAGKNIQLFHARRLLNQWGVRT